MHQEVADADGTPNQNYLRFGSLGWNERSHQKWTHGSPVTAGQSEAWRFLSMSIWPPGPGTCEKEDMPPDGFLGCANEQVEGTEGIQLQFHYSVLIAARLDLEGAQERLASAISALSSIMKPVLIATTERSWAGGKCLRTGEYAGSFTDAPSLGVFRSGRLHDQPPSIDMLVGRWREGDR